MLRRVLTPLFVMFAAVVAFVVGFSATSSAATAAEPADGSLLDLVKQAYAYAVAGHQLAAGAIGVVVIVGLLKRYGAGRFPWLTTDVGGAVTTLVASFAGTFAIAAASASFAWSMVWNAGGLAVSAAGGYVLIKKLLIVPILKPLVGKAPAWMQPILNLVISLFDASPALDDAAKAGDDAVKTNPGGGAVTPTGKPTDL